MVTTLEHFKNLYQTAKELGIREAICDDKQQTREDLEWCTMKAFEYAAYIPIVMIEAKDFYQNLRRKLKKT